MIVPLTQLRGHIGLNERRLTMASTGAAQASLSSLFERYVRGPVTPGVRPTLEDRGALNALDAKAENREEAKYMAKERRSLTRRSTWALPQTAYHAEIDRRLRPRQLGR